MIRAYQHKDTKSILDVWYQASLVAHPFLDQTFLEKEKINIQEIYLPNTKTWVFQENEQVVGFISMMDNEVGAIFVYPTFHGKKIGFQLMNHVATKFDTLEVEVFERNKVGRTFYDRYGFTFLKKYVHEETGFEMLRLEFSGESESQS